MARYGLLADSHGRASTTRRAVALLMTRRVDAIVHLGDLGTVEVIDALAVDGPDDDQLTAHLVFGNTDWDIGGLTEYAQDLDINVDHPLGWIETEGGKVAFCHGHEPEVMQRAMDQGAAYLCYGHTHRPSDERRGATRLINPGALFRASEYTVAVLDTDKDEVEFHKVDGG